VKIKSANPNRNKKRHKYSKMDPHTQSDSESDYQKDDDPYSRIKWRKTKKIVKSCKNT